MATVRGSTLAVAVTALLLTAGALGSAQAGDLLSAEALQLEGTTETQTARLAWFQGADRSTAFDLAITAASMDGVLYETRYVDGPETPSLIGDRAVELDVPVPEDGDTTVQEDAPRLTLLRAAALPRLGLRAEAGGQVAATLEGEGARIHSQDGARLDGDGISEREGDPGGTEADASFQVTEIPGPMVLEEVGTGPVRFVLEGDFTLELDEMDLLLEAGGSQQELRTVTHREALAGTGPDTVEVDGFLRLHLTDARLVLTSQALDGRVQVAAHDWDAMPSGGLTVINARGLLLTAVDEILLEDESYTVAEPLPFSARGQGDRVAIQVEEPAGPGPFTALIQAAASPFQGSMQVVLFIAILSAGFIVAVLAAAVLASPSMSRVESAIGEGRYRRAARMAGRILSRHPEAENAQVARAVALSKSGDHSKVIHEVEASLSKSDPSDGVLHYVLGLAYMETGRHKEAADRFQEAMARTPELGPEVERLVPSRRRGPTYGYV